MWFRISLLTVLMTLTAQVFASDLTDCELALAKRARQIQIGDQTVSLTADQILFDGNLFHKQSPERANQTFWMVSDTFLGREVAPDLATSTKQFLVGDQVFILDEQNHVVMSGYYGECRYQPFLYADSTLTRLLISSDEFRSHFYKQQRVAAILNLHPLRRQMFDVGITTWLPRYEEHQSNPSRFVQVGSSTLERAHFEGYVRGTIVGQLSLAKDLNANERRAYPSGPIQRLELKFVTDDGATPYVQPGSRLFFLDEQGNPSEELIIGTQSAPLIGERARLAPFAKQVEKKRRAILFLSPFVR